MMEFLSQKKFQTDPIQYYTPSDTAVKKYFCLFSDMFIDLQNYQPLNLSIASYHQTHQKLSLK